MASEGRRPRCAALRAGFDRPGRLASAVRCPVLALAYDQDGAALAEPAVRAAHLAPRGGPVRLPGGHSEAFMDGHSEAFMDGHDVALEIQLSFLRRHLLHEPTRSHRTAGQTFEASRAPLCERLSRRLGMATVSASA